MSEGVGLGTAATATAMLVDDDPKDDGFVTVGKKGLKHGNDGKSSEGNSKVATMTARFTFKDPAKTSKKNGREMVESSPHSQVLDKMKNFVAKARCTLGSDKLYTMKNKEIDTNQWSGYKLEDFAHEFNRKNGNHTFLLNIRTKLQFGKMKKLLIADLKKEDIFIYSQPEAFISADIADAGCLLKIHPEYQDPVVVKKMIEEDFEKFWYLASTEDKKDTLEDAMYPNQFDPESINLPAFELVKQNTQVYEYGIKALVFNIQVERQHIKVFKGMFQKFQSVAPKEYTYLDYGSRHGKGNLESYAKLLADHCLYLKERKNLPLAGITAEQLDTTISWDNKITTPRKVLSALEGVEYVGPTKGNHEVGQVNVLVLENKHSEQYDWCRQNIRDLFKQIPEAPTLAESFYPQPTVMHRGSKAKRNYNADLEAKAAKVSSKVVLQKRQTKNTRANNNVPKPAQIPIERQQVINTGSGTYAGATRGAEVPSKETKEPDGTTLAIMEQLKEMAKTFAKFDEKLDAEKAARERSEQRSEQRFAAFEQKMTSFEQKVQEQIEEMAKDLYDAGTAIRDLQCEEPIKSPPRKQQRQRDESHAASNTSDEEEHDGLGTPRNLEGAMDEQLMEVEEEPPDIPGVPPQQE